MPRYDHAFSLAFSLISDHPTGDDITPEQFRAAINRRMDEMDQNNEWHEAIGNPYDSFETE